MTSTDILKLLAGPVIGAIIALSAIWIKEALDKKKSVQSWFEQNYIVEGIDLLIAHFIALETLIMDKRFTRQFVSSDSSKIISTAEDLTPPVIAKAEAICQDRIFVVSAKFILYSAITEDSYKLLEGRLVRESLKLAKRYNKILIGLRRDLLQIRIKNKTDIYKLAEYPKIVQALDETHKAHIEMLENLGLEFEKDEKGHLLMELN